MKNDFTNVISLWDEMVAYETLWAMPDQSLKTIHVYFAEFKKHPTEILHEIWSSNFNLEQIKKDVEKYLKELKNGFSVCINGTFHYPKKLRDARYPIELFYYKGDIGYLESTCISVVGTRNPSEEGMKRTRKLVKGLIEKGYTVLSGLAKGIDTVAMKTAIEEKGNTIGIIGTPITEYYPKENKEFQDYIANNKLLISQVPFYRYSNEPFYTKKRYFPQRNETMAALSKATIIVEASESSGTLTQARACLQQGRKLYILNSCFENPNISWPRTYAEKGAVRVRDFDDIFSTLEE